MTSLFYFAVEYFVTFMALSTFCFNYYLIQMFLKWILILEFDCRCNRIRFICVWSFITKKLSYQVAVCSVVLLAGLLVNPQCHPLDRYYTVLVHLSLKMLCIFYLSTFSFQYILLLLKSFWCKLILLFISSIKSK